MGVAVKRKTEAAVLNFQKALGYLRDHVGDLGLIQIIMLVEIFENDGITQHELQKNLNLLQGTVSKNCRRFATAQVKDPKTGEKHEVGLDLIKLRPDPQEYRRLACYLTSKGKQIKRNLYNFLL